MGSLSYTATMSLDGYVTDASGDFRWTAPTEEIFDYHLKRVAGVSTEVLGRKSYQLMTYWEGDPEEEEWGEAKREFADCWQTLDVFVASSTIEDDDLGPNTPTVVRDLTLEELERIVAGASGEVEIFGPTVASDAIRAGMVKNFHFFVSPRMLGGGLRALPLGADLAVDLVERHEFGDGTMYLHYRLR